MANNEEPEPRRTAPTSYPCPKCGKTMHIAFVEPVDPEQERRRFDCAGCSETKTVVVRYR